MVKVIVWIVTLIGLTAPLAVAVMGLVNLYALRQARPRRYLSPEADIYIHDSYFMLGSWRLDFNPQYWSIAVLITGIVMVLVALFAILRSSTV